MGPLGCWLPTACCGVSDTTGRSPVEVMTLADVLPTLAVAGSWPAVAPLLDSVAFDGTAGGPGSDVTATVLLLMGVLFAVPVCVTVRATSPERGGTLGSHLAFRTQRKAALLRVSSGLTLSVSVLMWSP